MTLPSLRDPSVAQGGQLVIGGKCAIVPHRILPYQRLQETPKNKGFFRLDTIWIRFLGQIVSKIVSSGHSPSENPSLTLAAVRSVQCRCPHCLSMGGNEALAFRRNLLGYVRRCCAKESRIIVVCFSGKARNSEPFELGCRQSGMCEGLQSEAHPESLKPSPLGEGNSLLPLTASKLRRSRSSPELRGSSLVSTLRRWGSPRHHSRQTSRGRGR